MMGKLLMELCAEIQESLHGDPGQGDGDQVEKKHKAESPLVNLTAKTTQI